MDRLLCRGSDNNHSNRPVHCQHCGICPAHSSKSMEATLLGHFHVHGMTPFSPFKYILFDRESIDQGTAAAAPSKVANAAVYTHRSLTLL